MEGAQPEHRLSASSLNAVEKFHGGRREDPVDWLNKLNRIGRNFNWSDRNKVDVALLRICGPAAVWAESIDSEVPWSEFELLFMDRFTEPIEEAMARLTRCKQGPYESIIAYTDRFKSDARSANGVEDGALVWQYLEGMNPDLRVEIYRQGGNRPQSIDEISRFLKGWEANSASLNRFGPDPSNPPRDNRRNTDGTWTRFSNNNNNGPRNPNRGWSSGRYDGSNSRPRDFGNWRPRPPQQQYQDRALALSTRSRIVTARVTKCLQNGARCLPFSVSTVRPVMQPMTLHTQVRTSLNIIFPPLPEAMLPCVAAFCTKPNVQRQEA